MDDPLSRPLPPVTPADVLFTLQVCFECGFAWEWPVDLLPLELCFDCRVEGPWAIGEVVSRETMRSDHARQWVAVMRYHTKKMQTMLEGAGRRV